MSLSVSKNESLLKLKIAENARIFPFKHPLARKKAGQKQKWIHGVETKEDIEKIYLDQHREDVSTVDYMERKLFLDKKFGNGFVVPEIEGKWMYGGILYDHFGHVLSESAQRLWCWRHVASELEGIIFLTSGPEHIDEFGSYLYELFDLWNIDKDKIKIVTEISNVECLYLPKPGGSIGTPQEDWYEHELEALTPSDLFQERGYPENIVFSRKKFLTSGKIIGFSVIESLLQEYGYKIICPEDCSLIEQIRLIVNAKKIVWEEGSNIHVLDILPRQKLHAYVFKRRRLLRTFDMVLERKVRVLYNFDLTKQITSVYANLEKDITECKLEGVAVNRMSLCVVSRLHHLRKYLVDELQIDSISESSNFKVFLYKYITQECEDIEFYVNDQTVVIGEDNKKNILNHLRTQYTFIRAADKEMKKTISDLTD